MVKGLSKKELIRDLIPFVPSFLFSFEIPLGWPYSLGFSSNHKLSRSE